MGYETIIWDQDGGLVTVTLNRPEMFNALNPAMAAELVAAWEQAGADPTVRAVLVTGAGKAFQAGQDLGEVAAMRERGTFSEYLAGSWDPVVTGLWNLAKPTVAAVNGPVIGAGMALALACDLLIASERATFTAPFTRLGFVPDAGLTWLLPRIVGLPRAKEIIYLTDPVDAARAERMGLVNEVVAPGALVERATAVARRLAEGPTVALGQAKRILHAAADATLPEAMTLEGAAQDVAGAADDCREGVAAFLEKRPPRYTGR